MRTLRWRVLEGLREFAPARFLLGVLSLIRAFRLRRQGETFSALDASSRVLRIVGIRLLERIAARFERSLSRRTTEDAEGRPLPMSRNTLIDSFQKSRECAALMSLATFTTPERRTRMGGELLLLKEPDEASGELGVIILKYTGSFGRFQHVYDVPAVLDRYQLVLEPSWIGYQDPTFRLYLDSHRPVYVQAQHEPDAQVLEAMRANLVPVPIGAGHWVNSEHFHPIPGVSADYLAVQVANWAPLKRHHLLLDALGRVKDAKARIALVGYPWKGYTRERLEDSVRRRGLEGRVDFYERISRKEVNEIFNRSHCNLVLSRKEGASKVFYESLAAGTPSVVLDDHEGVRAGDVNDRTGAVASAGSLCAAMEMLRDEGHTLDPHGWWLENASIDASTAKLEARLREGALAMGRPFTRGIHRKTNDPNLDYLDPTLHERMAPAYADLAKLMRPGVD